MWLILRTEHSKEQAVARAIEDKGYRAWHPVQIKMVRSGAVRRRLWGAHEPLKEKRFAILPRVVFASMPEEQALGLAGVAVQRDFDNLASLIPDSQIAAFRTAIDQLNKHVLAMASLAEQRKARKAWKSLQDGLKELLEQSQTKVEEAA